jgi:hypothetical protein
MRIATRRRMTRLYNNAGPLVVAAGIVALTLASLLLRGRL